MIAPVAIDVEVTVPLAFVNEPAFFSNSTRRFVLRTEIDLDAMQVQLIEGVADNQVHRARHYPSSRVSLVYPVTDMRGPESAICNSSESYLTDEDAVVPNNERCCETTASLVIEESNHGAKRWNQFFRRFRGRSRFPLGEPIVISAPHLLPSPAIASTERSKCDRPIRER